MLRLDLSPEPRWFDLGYGVRLKMVPLTTAVMLSGHKDPEVLAIRKAAAEGGDVDENAAALVVAKVVARTVIDEWEGVGGDDGKPVPVSPEGINALLDMWSIFEAFQEKYMSTGLLLEQEKNVSAPSPSGSTAAAMDTAKPARKRAKTARRNKTSR